jgi:hypothetical protein
MHNLELGDAARVTVVARNGDSNPILIRSPSTPLAGLAALLLAMAESRGGDAAHTPKENKP